MAALRLLATAAATGRVGYVFFIGGRLMDWSISDRASKSTKDAAEVMQIWIEKLKPDIVVTEDTRHAVKKSDITKSIIDAMARVAEDAQLLDTRVQRMQTYENKYEEAAAIAKRYPELEGWLPTGRVFFDNEPRSTVLFEAVALAQKILNNPTTELASAMG